MRVGILGAGRMGGAAARVLTRAGYEVLIANRRGRVSLSPLVDEIGSGVVPANAAEAAGAPIVLLAVPYGAVEELLEEVGPLPASTVLIDATNAWSGWEALAGEAGSSEAVARMAGGARVVKALNTVHANRLAAPDGLGVPLAGDDPDARATVARLLERVGFRPVEIPSLRAAADLMAPNGPLFGLTLEEPALRDAISPSS
ncbi:MAG: NAD(P)-binding domain-containing protein [Thermoleophilia bacterium]